MIIKKKGFVMLNWFLVFVFAGAIGYIVYRYEKKIEILQELVELNHKKIEQNSKKIEQNIKSE